MHAIRHRPWATSQISGRRNGCAAATGRCDLLSLCERISLFIAPHIQQFAGADLEVSAEAYIESEDILLVQGSAVDAFETDIVLIHEVGIHRARGPYLGSAVADIKQVKFYSSMALAFFCYEFRLFLTFYEHVYTHDIFLFLA